MADRKVFLSYARADSAVVTAFAQKLRASGFEVFLDVEFLRAGERFDRAILDHILAADAFVYFASPTSLRPEWVNREFAAFITNSQRPVVPVLIDDTTFAELPAPLVAYQGP